MGTIKFLNGKINEINFGNKKFIFNTKVEDYNRYMREISMKIEGEKVNILNRQEAKISAENANVKINTEIGGITFFGKFKKVINEGKIRINIARDVKVEEIYSKSIHILYPFEYERMKVERIEYLFILWSRDFHFLKRILKEGGAKINYILTSSPIVWDEVGKSNIKRILVLGAEDPYYSINPKDQYLETYKLKEHYWANYVPKWRFKLRRGERIISPLLIEYFKENPKEKPESLEIGTLIFEDSETPENKYEDTRKRIPALFTKEDVELSCVRYVELGVDYANIRINGKKYTLRLG